MKQYFNYNCEKYHLNNINKKISSNNKILLKINNKFKIVKF